jgi:hypothetical protein
MGGIVGGGGGGGGSTPAPEYGTLPSKGGVDYSAPQTGEQYVPSYAPQNATPFLQSIMAQQSTPLQQGNNLGLPSLQSMFGMQQRSAPYQSGLQQLAPLAPYVGSTYRPDMSGAIAKLNDVNPSVATEQARAKAEADRLAALEAANPRPAYDYGGGGGA